MLDALLRRLRSRSGSAHRVRPGFHIGDATAAERRGHEFDRVFSVAEGLSVSATTDSYELTVDASVLDRRDEFAAAVDATTRALASDDRLLLHCYEGMERAPTVGATAIAVEEGMAFDAALAEIRDVRPIVDPTPPLRTLGRAYVSGRI